MMKRKVRDLLPAALFSLQAERQDVDLVLRDGIFLYVYKDNWFYTTVKEADRGFDAERYKSVESRLRQERPDAGEFTGPERVLANIAARGRRPHYFDIGTNYGQWVIRARRALGEAFSGLEVACFEPGLASRLAVVNLALNDLYEVDFYAGAVSHVDGIIPFFAAPGHTEDNKLVNRRERHSMFPAWSISAESLLSGVPSDSEVFLKIDTQGAEWEIFSSMVACWNRPIAAVMEFFPNGFSSRVKPRDFLAAIHEVAHIAELDGHQRFRRFIGREDFGSLLEDLRNRRLPFCDLFLISRQHLRGDELRECLSRMDP